METQDTQDRVIMIMLIQPKQFLPLQQDSLSLFHIQLKQSQTIWSILNYGLILMVMVI